MFKNLSLISASFVTVLLLTACSGGGGGGNDSPTQKPTKQPEAKFTFSQQAVEANSTLYIDATPSIANDDGGIKSYTWTVDSQPDGSELKISPEVKPTFSPEVAGIYKICLVVNNAGKASDKVCNKLKVHATDQPVAIISNKQTALLFDNSTIQLDGSDSLKAFSRRELDLKYNWEILNCTPAEAIIFTPATSDYYNNPKTKQRVKVTLSKPGECDAKLTVTDTTGKSSEATIKLAVKKANQKVTSGGIKITVDGGKEDRTLGETISMQVAATDPDGDALKYSWEFEPKWIPKSSKAKMTVDSKDSSKASFVVDTLGSYHFKVYAHDGEAEVASYTTVIKANKLPANYQDNQKPVAVLKTNYNPNQVKEQIEVEPSGRVEFRMTDSYDKETAKLGYYKLEIIKQPDCFDANKVYTRIYYGREIKEKALPDLTSRSADQYFYPTCPGVYQFKLTVNDTTSKADGAPDDSTCRMCDWGMGDPATCKKCAVDPSKGNDSEPVYVSFDARVGANLPPTATLAKYFKVAQIGKPIQLDARPSTDENGDKLSYQWQVVRTPANSNLTIDGNNTDKATIELVPDAPGIYKIGLVVKDPQGSSSNEEAKFSARKYNLPPTLDPRMGQQIGSAEQPYVIYQDEDAQMWSAMGLINGASDPDGDEIKNLYRITKSPKGAKFHYKRKAGISVVSNSNEQNCVYFTSSKPTVEEIAKYEQQTEFNCFMGMSLSPDTAGEYEVTTIAADTASVTDPYTFNFTAVKPENFPTLLLEDTREDEHIVGTSSSGDPKVSVGKITSPESIYLSLPYQYVTGNLNQISGSLFKLVRDVKPTLIVRSFKLTAFDKDYTIDKLKVVNQDSGYKLEFAGITNGAVIKLGQSVEFKLLLTRTTDEAKCTKINHIGNEVSKGEWSFEIKEKPEWKFAYKPIVNCY